MIKQIIFNSRILQFAYRATIWHVRYCMGLKVTPLACGFYITSKCNFKCNFCNIWRIKPGFIIPEDDAVKLIGSLGRMGVIYFSISGGEPLLIPYVFDLLAFAKKSGILYTHIVSNGYLMDENKAKKLNDSKVSEISFSLDGDENNHDKNRGLNGSFRKVIEAIQHVKTHAPKTKIVLNTILNPACPENAVSALKTAEQLGVKIKVQPVNNHPSFGVKDCAVKSSRSMLTCERQKLIEAINQIQKSPSLANSKPFFDNYKAFMFHQEDLIFRNDNCIFGYHHLEIYANQIFPCLEGLDWREGFDISNESLKDILSSEPYQSKLQYLKKCTNCSRNYYVCYYEPRMNFPLWNLLKSRLRISQKNNGI